MNLTPAQRTIASDTHRFRVINCGRRFGKTTEAVEEIKGETLAALENDKICYIAPTYQQARDIAWEAIKRELRPIITKVNESRLELEVLNKDGNKVFVVLRGWEAIETLRGQNFRFLVLDEVASMRNFWVGWNEVLSPTLIDRRGSALFISTPKGFNHFYDLFNMQDKDDNFKSFHFTSYDNPHIPIEELEREKKAKPEDTFAQEYLADFRKTQGLVYKDFNRNRHTYGDGDESAIGFTDRLIPVDFGYTNPCAMYLVRKDRDAHYWISDEYYKTGKTTPEIIDMAKSLRGTKYYPDPAEPDRIEEMKRAGLNVCDVSKDIEAGISSVQQLLKTDRLHVHISCVNLINEFETYRYPDKKPDMNEKETPIKEHDHALDAIRYALYMQEGDFETLNYGEISSFIPSFDE